MINAGDKQLPSSCTGPGDACPHLQDLDVGLMRIRHLHPVDLDEAERWDLVHVGSMLQAAHHLVDGGRLPRPRHARDVHTPETGAATRQVSGQK